MRARLAQREPEILVRWKKLDIYHYLRQQRSGCKKWILHDGPPYANGKIHIGHAVNKTLKDIINKSRWLMGFDVPYVPGWDCHGLPIEVQMEKRYGRPGGKLSAAQFRAACRDYAREQLIEQRKDFERLGLIGDWEHPYLTMDPHVEADTIRALGEIIRKGHLVRGNKPVHWCFDCGSALAEAEIEYCEKVSTAIDVAFPVREQEDFLHRLGIAVADAGEGTLAVVIWTTTPWTIPSNQFVTLNPDLDYTLVQASANGVRRRLLLASAQVNNCLQRYEMQVERIIASAKGAAFIGAVLQHPYYSRSVPIFPGNYVSADEGSGAVHGAPAYGVDDFLCGKAQGMEILTPVNAHGYFHEEVEQVAGWHVFRDEKKLVSLLAASGNLLRACAYPHSYPHCWRHKKPTIYRATAQWFVSMEAHNLRAQVCAEIPQVQWTPAWGETRLAGMIGQRPDWCISRQRYWGVPIPLWTHCNSGGLHPRTQELLEVVAQRVEKQGVDAWFTLNDAELLGADAAQYERSNDTLDVWFDSGSTHHSVLKQRAELNFPADLYLEGSDQHRGWFHSSILNSVAINGTAPYRAVLTHGFTVDAQGRKMSKSLGNIVAPQTVIDKLGADVLRLWIAATDFSGEMSISDEILARTADAYRRIRNTIRFLLANTHDFVFEQHQVAATKWVALDAWIIDYAYALQQRIVASYEAYRLAEVVQSVHQFCSITLGAFYLEVIKDRQYTLPADSHARRSAQTAMYHLLEALLLWIAPILSFTAEEAWGFMPQRAWSTIFAARWYTDLVPLPLDAPLQSADWERLLKVRQAVNLVLEELRANKQIGASLEARVALYAATPDYQLLSILGDELRFLLITSEAQVMPLDQSPENASATTLEGIKIVAQSNDCQKCARCWHRTADVGTNSQYTDLCARCVINLKAGEKRIFC